MLNKFLNEINLSIKILTVILLIVTLFIAKSIYLILFISILILILITLSNKNVKFYFRIIKRLILWLLFITFIYIIIYRFSISILSFDYKVVLTILLINILLPYIAFDNLHSAIYTLLLPLKNANFNLYNISFNMTLSIYSFLILMKAGNKIKKSQLMYGKTKYGLKYYLLPQLFRTMKDTEDFKNNLKLKFYVLKKERMNINSIIIFILSNMLFIAALFKEVIL